MTVILNTLIWATAATIGSQLIAVLLVAWIGVPPKKLAHELEETQNVAIGAIFFIISLTASIFIGVLVAEPTEADSTLATLAWIGGGLLLSLVYTIVNFWIAHEVLDPVDGENVYTYIRRELVDEQNAALAFFLGGLMVAPFISVLSQII